MATPALPDLATIPGTPADLVQQARRIFQTQPEKAAALQLAGINKLLAQVAPGEDPEAAAKRLAKERNRWDIRAGYMSLLWYYQDSLDPGLFCIHDAEEREMHLSIAEDMLTDFDDDILPGIDINRQSPLPRAKLGRRHTPAPKEVFPMPPTPALPDLATLPGSPAELVQQARRIFQTQPEKAAALQLAGINKLLAQVAPGEHPKAAARRLAEERNRSGIRAGYGALLWYYEDSLDPGRFCIYDAEEREIHLSIAEDMLTDFDDDNG